MFGFSFRVVMQNGFFVSLFVINDVVGSNNDFVPYGNNRFFLTTSGNQALVFPFQVTVFFAGCAPGTFG
jgi:hypothetical protein